MTPSVAEKSISSLKNVGALEPVAPEKSVEENPKQKRYKKSDEVENPTTSVEIPVQQPKKRGRSTKNVIVEESTIIQPPTDDKIPVQEPKKRGRPKKNVIVEEPAIIQPPIADHLIVHEPKKREPPNKNTAIEEQVVKQAQKKLVED